MRIILIITGPVRYFRRMSRPMKITAVIVLVIAILYLWLKPKMGEIVMTKSGPVKGIISVSRDGREFYEWLGIPYAAPPVGERRFANPQPIEPWDSVRDASTYGSGCLQTIIYLLVQFGQEDCLFLNVHVPKLEDTTRSKKVLPVMIYIHGGAFINGNSREYRPDYFMDHDVIVVTINYRLGVFGFLSTGDETVSGNMGLKDQALAIKWVHENIQAFGGDPNHITLFGESAGAVSTHYQLLSGKTKGMIKNAIALSGSAGGSWRFTPLETVVRKSRQIAKSFKCPITNTPDMIKCLRDVPASDLLYSMRDDVKRALLFFPQYSGYMFNPTAEPDNPEAFITDHPFEIMEQGRGQRIPLLAGLVADEGLLSVPSFHSDEKNLKLFEDNWEEQIAEVCNLGMRNKSEVAKAIKEFYFPPEIKSYEEKLEGFKKLFGDCFFNLGVHRTAHIQREFSPVYLYFYNIHEGPSLVQALVGIGDTFHPAIDTAISFAKMFIKEIILGWARKDLGVCHFDDAALAFPAIAKIREGHRMYMLSKGWVQFLVNFATNEHANFMGEVIKPMPKNGPLNYLEISDEPHLITPDFVSRVEFLHSVGIK